MSNLGRNTGFLLALSVVVVLWTGSTSASDVIHVDQVRREVGADPVCIRGVVTFVDPRWNMLFVQDESRGIYVHNAAASPWPAVLDIVELKGDAHPGHMSFHEISTHGKAEFPTPVDANSTHATPRELDAQWVKFHGVVRRVDRVEGHSILKVVNSYQYVFIFITGADLPEDLVGAAISAEGVWKHIDERNDGRWHGEMFVPKLDLMKVEAKSSSIDPLDGFSRDNQYVRSEGVVRCQLTANEFLLETHYGVIRALGNEKLELSVGNKVEVAGFLAHGHQSLVLEDINVNVTGISSSEMPIIELAEAEYGDPVRISGRILRVSEGEKRLTIDSQGTIVVAKFPSESRNDLTADSDIETVATFLGVDAEGIVRVQVNRNSDLHVASNSQTQASYVSPYASALAVLAGVAVLCIAMITLRRGNPDIRRIDKRLSELAHSGRMVELGEMVTGIAHELNQPLSAICNNVHICRRRCESAGELRPDVSETLDKIKHQAIRMGDTLRRLRGLTKKTDSISQPAEVGDLVTEAVATCRDAQPEHTNVIHVDLAQDLPKVFVDSVQIQQVLINLIRNAVEATEDLPKPTVEVSAQQVDSGDIEICVSDNGVGLPTDNPDAVFAPNFTTKKDGIGVGLCISKSIVETHGGRLIAERRNDRGALFRVVLPARPTCHV